MDVVYACNDSYINQTVISMVSLVKHNENVCIHLAADGISTDNIKNLKTILRNYGSEINIIDAAPILEEVNLNRQDRHPRTIYAKLFLNRFIAADKVLYLDSDTLITASLEELFQRDMRGELIAGVLMPYSDKLKHESNLLPEDRYICDGVVLFNMKLWKEKGKEEVCITYINKYEGTPPMQSEGTLNYVCRGHIGVLDPEYNVMPSMLMYTGEQVIRLFKASVYYNPVQVESVKGKYKIIHFMNELYNRPWYESSKHPLKMEYLKIEKEIFDGKTISNVSLASHTAWTVWLIEHLPFVLFKKLYHLKNGL